MVLIVPRNHFAKTQESGMHRLTFGSMGWKMATQPPPRKRALREIVAKPPRKVKQRRTAKTLGKQLPLGERTQQKFGAQEVSADWRATWTRFADYESTGSDWITIASGHFFPDYLTPALDSYVPAIERFGELTASEISSEGLVRAVLQDPLRRQLIRIFRRYVCPTAPVELMKRAGDVDLTISRFGAQFRPIGEVRAAFATRPLRDEALAAILWEHQERGKRGADLTEQFFSWVHANLPTMVVAGGRDIQLKSIFDDYPKTRGVDFVISEHDEPLAVGYLHYDSDRGGSQEGDRTGGYGDAAEEIGDYLNRAGERTKIVFINDGPGLLAGAMWRKYGGLETRWPKRTMVATMKMLNTRLSADWLRS